MKLLLTTCLLLVVCFLAFLISNLYLPHHEEFSADVKKRCGDKILHDQDTEESNSCRFLLEVTPNLKFFMETVRFVSLCSAAILIFVSFYCLCDRERKLQKSLARELELSQRVGQHEATIGQYKQRLRVNKRSEHCFETELDQRKSEVAATQSQVEMMGQWNNSLTERNVNLGKQVKRQHVRERANWARTTLQRKKESEMKKKLNRSAEEIGAKSRENQGLEEALAREREERERMEKEYMLQRDQTLAQHLAERDRLERERGEERERWNRERQAERQELERRVQQELQRIRAGRAQEEEGGWGCVVS